MSVLGAGSLLLTACAGPSGGANTGLGRLEIPDQPASQATKDLWRAAETGDVAGVKAALAAGADIEGIDFSENKNGRRALNYAALNNQSAVIDVLLLCSWCHDAFGHAQSGRMNGQTQHQVLRRETDIARIASPIISELHAYWTAKRGLKEMPAWADIEPTEMRGLLPNLIVAGIEHDPLRVFYRLAGTLIVEFRGEITGHFLEEVPWSSPAGQANAKEAFARVVASRAPLFSEVDITTSRGAVHRMFSGVWPLAPTPGGVIDRCLAAEDYGDLTRTDLA
ncbi:MAG: PAS domain-containing protein [Rhodospirillaceae bacterium]|nr:PAS domain-containing protein [Rhodospirillaceae bacterium]